MSAELTSFDLDLRRRIYDGALEHGSIPGKAQLAQSSGAGAQQIAAGLQRLSDAHMIVLQPENGEVLMANPFSAVPTPFLVRVGERAWYGNCIWDAMGIAAMTHRDAVLETSCGCCGYAIGLKLPGECRDEDERIAHFAIPAKRWWDDIVFN